MPIDDKIEYTLLNNYNKDHEEWRQGGLLHNINDEPAVVVNGGEELKWYKRGMLHREVGPAWVIGATFNWYRLNLRHRVDKPAIITPTKEEYWHHGHKSRRDGPAIQRANGEIEWWYNNIHTGFEEWAELTKCENELYIMLKLEWHGQY